MAMQYNRMEALINDLLALPIRLSGWRFGGQIRVPTKQSCPLVTDSASATAELEAAMKLFLIRHGETVDNVAQIWYVLLCWNPHHTTS